MNKLLLFFMTCVVVLGQTQPTELNVALKKYGATSTHNYLIDSDRNTGNNVNDVSVLLYKQTSVSKFHAHFVPVVGKLSIYSENKLVAVVFMSGSEDEFTVDLNNVKMRNINLRFQSKNGNGVIELREVEIYTKDAKEIEEYTKLIKNIKPTYIPVLTPVDPSINVSRSR